LQESVTRGLAGTYTANATLQPGVVGGLDASSGFGWKGTSRIPGSTETFEESLPQVDDGQALSKPEACASGTADSDCKVADRADMPYPSNRVLSSLMRFFR
jgi:hypothetical protein